VGTTRTITFERQGGRTTFVKKEESE